jgi:hypothetical protein
MLQSINYEFILFLLGIGVYYQRLKSIADELRELGDPIVEDR